MVPWLMIPVGDGETSIARATDGRRLERRSPTSSWLMTSSPSPNVEPSTSGCPPAPAAHAGAFADD